MMQAVIFDFDGVVVDSEDYWPAAENNAYKRLIPSWSDEDHHAVVGTSMEDTYHLLVEQFGLTHTKAEFMALADEIASAAYRHCQLVDGMAELLQALQKQKLPYAIASSSYQHWIEPTLEKLQLREQFPIIACASEIEPGQGKPNPTLYLLAAEKLGVEPANCIAIEDSTNGIQAAKNAGMFCIALDHGREGQDQSAADVIVKSLREIDLQSLIAQQM